MRGNSDHEQLVAIVLAGIDIIRNLIMLKTIMNMFLKCRRVGQSWSESVPFNNSANIIIWAGLGGKNDQN